MRILSIQSWVSHGHVGNASALFALQRIGVEVIGVHTVQLSNHTGYGDWTGRRFEAGDVASLIDGIDRRGMLAETDAVLSGYAGDAAIGEAVLDAVGRVRRVRGGALYACDPVMGDDGRGLFVSPELVGFFRDRAVGDADVMTPNRFELGLLTGETDRSLDGTRRAAMRLRDRMRGSGPRAVLVTSVDGTVDVTGGGTAGGETLDLLVCTGEGAHRLRTERIPIEVNGAGDLIAALFLARVLEGCDPVEAAARAAASTWGIIAATHRLGRSELALVSAQEELVRPSRRFEPIAC